MRDRLIELIREPIPVTDGVDTFGARRLPLLDAERIADRIIANGWMPLPQPPKGE